MTRLALLLAAVALAGAGCGVPRWIAPAPADRVWIDPGDYALGSDAEDRAVGYRLSPPYVADEGTYDAWERRPHHLYVSGFWMDRHPVTEAEYARFVEATGWREPGITPVEYGQQVFLVHDFAAAERYAWQEGKPPEQFESHPAVLVDRDDAEAYCGWRGARLPTEAEWEAACRGFAHRRFPWGDSWREGAAAIGGDGTAPVGSHPLGDTPDGIEDLAGNVFEWTSSTFSAGRATLKGCAWSDSPGACRCAFRHGRPPTARHPRVGFRCVSDP